MFGFEFDKLNTLEIKSLAILDTFRMMKVHDLLPLPEEQVFPFLDNIHLFSFALYIVLHFIFLALLLSFMQKK